MRRAALTRIADELARAGMYEQAVDLARSVFDDLDAEPYALVGVARGLARAGDHDRALDLAHSITDTRRHAGALAAVADVLAETGHPHRATELAESVPVPEQRCEALVLVTDTLAKTGRHEQAAAVLDRAITDARPVTDTPRDGRARVATVGALADIGRIDQAILLANSISDHRRSAGRAWGPRPRRRRTPHRPAVQPMAIDGTHTGLTVARPRSRSPQLDTPTAVTAEYTRGYCLLSECAQPSHCRQALRYLSRSLSGPRRPSRARPALSSPAVTVRG
ncbi:hypothetical protein [Saccharothrix australiensis]|uniref:hypothetical protein n=1 Tax=Saccharothrix australiensis TaxID=2072 RepID=UPI0011C36113|nr:hypothetical protein [Saccharothrix australiensis]